MDIKDYFVSDEFIDVIRPIGDIIESNQNYGFSAIEYIIRLAINYSMLFKNGDKFSSVGLSNFLKKVIDLILKDEERYDLDLKSNYKITTSIDKLFIEELLYKANLKEDDLKDDNGYQVISSYIFQKILGRKYIFHGFNSVILDSIMKNGINPNISFTPQNEINIINDIFKKYNIYSIFGWQPLNCVGYVSYSEVPSVSYYYAANSPEWFSQFTGQGTSFYPPNKYKKNAFLLGDYEGAKNNLIMLMNEGKFLDSDKDTVMNFFNKYWQVYSKGSPLLAIVPTEEYEDISWFVDKMEGDPYYRNDISKVISYATGFGSNDVQTESVIDVQNASFINLPRFDVLLEKLRSKENVIEEKQISPEKTLYEKLTFLSTAKIAIGIENGELINDNQERDDLEIARELLKDEDVFRAIVTNKFGSNFSLDHWIRFFDSSVINSIEGIKLLAINKPYYLEYVSEECRNDLEMMKIVASQKGVRANFLCYVGDNVKNDFQFISSLIINADEKTFDFYSISANHNTGSHMTYRDYVGIDVLCNIDFWMLLNSKIMSINENFVKKGLFFAIDKEMELALQYRDYLIEEDNKSTYPSM